MISSSESIAIAEATRLGDHTLLVFEGCNAEIIERHDSLLPILMTLAKSMNATVVGETWYDFNPHGCTCVVLLAESHIAAHSWPEIGVLVIDVFTCGPNIEAVKAGGLVMNRTLAKSWRFEAGASVAVLGSQANVV